MPIRSRISSGSSADPLISDLENPEDDIQVATSSSSKNDSKTSEGVHLKKELGLGEAIGILIGLMVGSGIFISPTGVVKYAGSVGLSLVIWAVAGVISIVGALCYAELGTMIPKSGGEYAYITDSFGGLLAFVYLWVSLVVIFPTANTIMSLTFANYILYPIFGQCIPVIAAKLIAALVITFLTYVNCRNVKVSSKISEIFTIAKILALIVIIITGFYAFGIGHTQNYQNAFEGSNYGFSSLATSYYQGFVSFAGWNCLNFIVEELKDPFKNLPRAILISLPIVTVVYFLTNVAYFAVLSPIEVLSSNAVAVTFGNKMLGNMAWIIPLFVACSSFGSINSGIFAASRLFFVGAREGQLPAELALINYKRSTPVPSLILVTFLSLLMLVSSDVQALINYISFSINVFIQISIGALLWQRYINPNRIRPIKIWIFLPIIFFIVNLLILVFTFIERPVEIGIAIGIILSGIPVYFIFVVRETKSPTILRMKASVTSFIQLITTSCPEQD